MKLPQTLQEQLTKYGHEDPLRFWDVLSEEEQGQLVHDLSNVDFAGLNRAFTRATQAPDGGNMDERMQPLPESSTAVSAACVTPETEAWNKLGLSMIGQGKVAAILLAGGMGTRLGSSSPKGCYDVGLPSHSSLFQLQAERIMKLQELGAAACGVDSCTITWYIMTSPATHGPTFEFFEKNKYFGLESNNVVFFQQDKIPCFSSEGKFMLETKSSLARSPNGNGGLYTALIKHGVLDDMRARGIEATHMYCVDNVLVKVCDPVFMGQCRATQSPVGAVVVRKAHAKESAGVVCLVDGKYQVVEYSEISEATAAKTTPSGALEYAAGNICNHFFSVDFLSEACAQEDNLLYHVAHKKIAVANEEGKPVKPKTNNGIKLEKFVFDVFPMASKLAVLEAPRMAAFSPLKNAAGAADGTADHCRSDLFRLHRHFLSQAGVTFVDAKGNTLGPDMVNESHVCEISPMASYSGEGLEALAKSHPKLQFPIRINAKMQVVSGLPAISSRGVSQVCSGLSEMAVVG